MATAEGPIGDWAGARREWNPKGLAALRLLAYVLATSIAVAAVVAVILAIAFERFATAGG